MTWLLLAVLAFVAFWAIGVMRARGGRAPNRLNNQGLPRPTDRDDHRRNPHE